MGRREMYECISFQWESQKEIDHWEHLDVGRRIILRWIFEKYHGVMMDWIYQIQDKGQWRALVNTAMNLHVP
jgi:hypothetical protein